MSRERSARQPGCSHKVLPGAQSPGQAVREEQDWKGDGKKETEMENK